jgi:5-methylcytosine-specific restriction endonuclease McrA
MTTGLRTLLLTLDYSPVSVFPLSTMPAEEAIKAVLNDSCILVEEYHRRILTPSRHDLFWPSVIANKTGFSHKNDVRLKKETLFYRDEGKCQFCHTELTLHKGPKEITRDHVTPKVMGGKDVWENCVAACSRCNLGKGSNAPKGIWVPKKRATRPSFREILEKRSHFPIVVDDEKWIDYLGMPWNAEVIVRKPHAMKSAQRKRKGRRAITRAAIQELSEAL